MLSRELWAEDTGVRPLHAAPSELERPDSVQRKSKVRLLFYYPYSIFISPKLFMGFAGDTKP